jgi:hypothetical protein
VTGFMMTSSLDSLVLSISGFSSWASVEMVGQVD